LEKFNIPAKAVKQLELHFRKDCNQIYNQISAFRQGIKSLQIHAMEGLFEQILHFLMLKDHAQQNQLPDVPQQQQAYSLIYDRQYLRFIKGKTSDPEQDWTREQKNLKY
jgi:DNA-binding FrmR family transcriptional regulator